MELERLEHQELERKLDIEKAHQRARVKQINQAQIAQKEALRSEARDEYLKEKNQVEALVDKIQQEDEMELAARRQKQAETREILTQWMMEQQARQREAIQRE